jgi:hypothetical protein
VGCRVSDSTLHLWWNGLSIPAQLKPKGQRTNNISQKHKTLATVAILSLLGFTAVFAIKPARKVISTAQDARAAQDAQAIDEGFAKINLGTELDTARLIFHIVDTVRQIKALDGEIPKKADLQGHIEEMTKLKTNIATNAKISGAGDYSIVQDELDKDISWCERELKSGTSHVAHPASHTQADGSYTLPDGRKVKPLLGSTQSTIPTE